MTFLGDVGMLSFQSFISVRINFEYVSRVHAGSARPSSQRNWTTSAARLAKPKLGFAFAELEFIRPFAEHDGR